MSNEDEMQNNQDRETCEGHPSINRQLLQELDIQNTAEYK